jgi:uncharacterized protein YajQ (UPF0234 family)
MADNHSFDIVSKLDYQEVSNAINQALKEIMQRFDLKDANCKIELNQQDNKLDLQASDEFKLKAVYEILQMKISKREISLKALEPGKIEKALGGTAKQEIKLNQGISKEQAKELNKKIKDSVVKVQTQIQGDQIRVIGKKIDDLQAVISAIKAMDLNFPVQFLNFK